MGFRLSDALDWLFARTTGGFKFGLERTEALLEHLGNPQRAYPTLHVAGTNGKGSSVATMAALLAAKGLRVATYTSPHLIDFRERIVVGGDAMPDEDIAAFIARHMPLIEELGASFFEATTAMAFDYFARAGAEVAVIETGLGGRLDSTNVIVPEVAGVTSIGLDHTEYLGDTLEEISAEKAGIFKRGKPAVIGEHDRGLRTFLAARARSVGASSVRLVHGEVTIHSADVDAGGTSVDLTWKGERATLRTPLAGRHQAQNLAFALVALDAAGARYAVSLEEAAVSLGTVRVPGRFQRVGKFIFDVAHNPAGSAVLAETLALVKPPRPVACVLCVLRDKDWRGMLRALAPAVDRFVLTNAPTAPASRAWDIAEAVEFAAANGLAAQAVPDFDAAIEAASVAETVVITGSFHTVGDAMSRLQVSPLAR